MSRRITHGAEAVFSSSRTAIAVSLLLSLTTSGCSLFCRQSPVEPAGDEPADSTSGEISASPSSEAGTAEPVLDEELAADGLLALGDGQLAEGDSNAAAETYSRLVEQHPQSDEAARALFQLATMQLDPSGTIYDRTRAVASLERIRLEHPGSPWAPAATLVLALTRREANLERTLEALESQLDELKKLDLSADPSDG